MDSPQDSWSPTTDLRLGPTKQEEDSRLFRATPFASLSHKLDGNILTCTVCSIARGLKKHVIASLHSS